MRSVAVLSALLWLVSFVMCFALLATPIFEGRHGLMNITESFGALERVALWQRSLSWFPGGHADGTFVTWPKPLITWAFRICLVVMFLLQWLAFQTAWRTHRSSLWTWLIGPIGAQIIMLLMAPSNADVFYYAMSGDMANNGVNPYLTELYKVAENPLYPYNHWIEITAVYGPLWTLINQGITGLVGNDPTRVILAYKIFFGIVAIVVAVAVWLAARLLRIRPRFAVAAAALVAWQPNMLIESAGQGHNDPLMMGFVLAAVTLTILGAGKATQGGVILVTLSALIKYVSLPMLGIVALTRLGRDRGNRRIFVGWAIDIFTFGAVLMALFGPYWTGLKVLQEMVTEPGRIYTNPIWFGQFVVIRQFHVGAAELFREITRPMLQVSAIILILIVIVRFGMVMWDTKETGLSSQGYLPVWTRAVLIAFATIFGILAFVPVNTHPWYWTWPVVAVALLVAWDGEDREIEPNGHRWFVPYIVLTAVLTLIYHTRICLLYTSPSPRDRTRSRM